MNKRGFTLVELLAVIALVAILSGLAIPNVITSVNNSRKASFLLDAKKMITIAESKISLDNETRTNVKNGTPKVYNLNELNSNRDFIYDSDGVEFTDESLNNSFVRVSFIDREFKYCLCLIGSKRQITGSSGTCDFNKTNESVDCIDSSLLNSINVIYDK